MEPGEGNNMKNNFKMIRNFFFASCISLAVITGCKMNTNSLLTESKAPFGAPEFDKIDQNDYLPAFEEAIAEAKAEVDEIVNNPYEPTFENTIEAMAFSGEKLNVVAGIFFNLMEANTNDFMQKVAEEVSPKMTEFSMYVSLNEKLFQRVKTVYEKRDSLGLDSEQMHLLEKNYKSFVRGGANLSAEDKEKYSKWSEELSLATLQFKKNVLASTNAYVLNVTDSTRLEGLPEYALQAAAQCAKDKKLEGWAFTLDYPSYLPLMKYCKDRELRKEIYLAYGNRGNIENFDNKPIVKQIVDLRIKVANILGYETWADYCLENRMAKDKKTVTDFVMNLLDASISHARKDVDEVLAYARKNGFEDTCLRGWDFTFWAERYQETAYSFNADELKPYFSLDNCIAAVFNLANTLYGISFEELDNVPVYHEDVKVYEVKDKDGSHMALFYADFFPRESKRGGAWMTEFRGQKVKDGVEYRPFISIVTNFTKPVGDTPALITHDEFTTLLHEFGHALHGIMANGRYESMTGTNVARDFVELPSQIMENWAFEPEYLNTFAKHYQTGETIPMEMIEKIVATKNYLAGYYQVRQLHFGLVDMKWHTCTSVPTEDVADFEHKVLAPYSVIPPVEGMSNSPAFSHIFSGGYSAGYYSYKWAEVLEADAFSLFKEKGIFNTDVAQSFRDNILSKGSSEDADVLYRNFRGRDPQPEALLKKFGLN